MVKINPKNMCAEGDEGLNMKSSRLRVAILGTGNIGTDLLFKVRRNPNLKCSYFVGRRPDSPGLKKASAMGISALAGGVDELLGLIDNVDLVFDATSARDHLAHVDAILNAGCNVINLTPAKSGTFFVPGISNEMLELTNNNLNMVTCGGQTTIPLIYGIKQEFKTLNNVEIVSTISSKSAGPATRRNLDEYIENTESAIKNVTGIENAKALLVLNPAVPEIAMHTSVYLDLPDISAEDLEDSTRKIESFVKSYCNGYSITSGPTKLLKGQIQLAVTVTGSGDYLPKHAGNLDIINEAAIFAASSIATLGKTEK